MQSTTTTSTLQNIAITAATLVLYYSIVVLAQPPIDSFPYLETFDGYTLCTNGCPSESQCLAIGDWTQEQNGAGLNWAVVNHVLAGCGSGPATGDHTSGSGRYMWIHQGRTDTCDSSSVEGLGCSSYFHNQEIGLISPEFSFAAIPPDSGIFLRYFTYMHGLRTGAMSLWVSTEGIEGPWVKIHSVSASKDRWIPQTVALSDYRGAQSIHLRFLAEMLPNSGESGFSLWPLPEALADQALDDVSVFLSNDSAVSGGSEDQAVWVDISRRFRVDGSLLNTQHAAGWFNAEREMITFGGLDQTRGIVKSTSVFDYNTKSWTGTTELTESDPLARFRAAAANNPDDTALFLYGGSEFTGPVPSVLWLDYGTREISQLTCTPSDSSDTRPNHALFPAEGATATATDSTGEFLVFGGRGIVIQLNFITKYMMGDGNCTYSPIRATTGAPPPRSRWGHVAAFWRDPDTDVPYLFGHGGRFQPSSQDPPRMLGDVFIFDLYDEEWRELRVLDPTQQPAPRSFHSAARNLAGDKMVIYGGLDDTDPDNTLYYSDAFVLQFDSENIIWKRLSTSNNGDAPVPRAHHSMVPLFFADTALVGDTDEGYLVFGGTTENGATSNNIARLNFGPLDLSPIPSDSSDDSDPTVAIVLGVLLPFCCILLLLVLFLVTLIAAAVSWRAILKRRIRKKYGVNQTDATAMGSVNHDDDDDDDDP